MEQKKRKSDFRLPSVDDLFSTQEMREVESMTSGHILDIPIKEIDDFPEHPFIVRDDDEMDALMDSIKDHGVIEPATVRKKENGRYEMISGHRRKHASSRLGLDTIRCEVVELTREEAILQMVESNLHREHILPSEKAFAYKMRLEALKRQGQRSDLNSDPVGPNLFETRSSLTSDPLGPKLVGTRSNEELAAETGDSTSQIKRYIRLTFLIPELLDLVDNSVLKTRGKLQIALRPAVELSYLNQNEQERLYDFMLSCSCTPSHAQAIILKNESQKQELTDETILSILKEEKANQKVKINLSEKVLKIIPSRIDRDNDVINEYLEKAINFYERSRVRKNEQEIEKPR